MLPRFKLFLISLFLFTTLISSIPIRSEEIITTEQLSPSEDISIIVTEVGNEGADDAPQMQEANSQPQVAQEFDQPTFEQFQQDEERPTKIEHEWDGSGRNSRPGLSYNTDDTGFDMQEMLSRVNEVRESEGLDPLQINPRLIAAAQDHSQDQARNGNMSHTGSDGSDHSERAERAGYNAGNLSENVAAGADSVDEVMEMWINSPGHLRNILDPKATEFGAANVDGFWTQLFGSQ